MAVQRGVHPSADVLKAFGLGKLDENSAGVVIDHLDRCEDCRKEVAAASGDDFLDRLRQAHGRSHTPAPANSLIDVARAAKPPASQTPIPNLPPELAANRQYEILRELGRGGMGVVYLARNKLMDRLEVLKVVNKALLDHPGAVERFLREIRSAAKLSHANVVTAHSAVQQGELLAFAMEFIEGQDLASLVKSQGPLPVPHACLYVQQAALGLQHAFEKGMVHRDIKPQNLILSRDGKKHIVKVLDFGLAKATREKQDDTGLTGEGKMLGTPDYIAPEQSLDAAKADIRADIYSLGCTLYYLLSGRAPFSGSSLAAVLMAHQMEEAKPLNLVRPEVPEELAAVVRKMMAKAPAKRYQTPLEVVKALAPFGRQGATPKPAPELSSGALEAKPAVKKAARVDPPPVPAAPEAKKQPEPANVWGSLAEDSVASVGARKSAVIRKPRAATDKERTARNKWLFVGGIGVGVLLLALLGMWAGGVFTTTVKTADGILVIEVNEPNAEVLVDGETATVSWHKGGKKAEIRVKPGTHKVEVKKDGFSADAKELTFKDGDREIFTARLLPEKRETKTAADDDKDFVQLFNGKDKTGWMTHPDQPGNWSVEEGILVGSGPAISHLYSKRGDYKDFRLRVVARINDGGNSGVFFRSRFGPEPAWPRGYEAQINSNSRDYRKTGSLFARGDSVIVRETPIPPGQWFTLEVIAQGNQIVVKVNGKTTADYPDDKQSYLQGHIALQLLGAATVVEFSKIEIKELQTKNSSQSQGSLPDDASVDDLRRVLRNEDPDLMEVALARLAKLGPNAKPALHDLGDTLTNARHPTKVRALAALALARIGPNAQPVVPAIVKTLERSQPTEIRQAAAEALAQIKYPANTDAVPGILDAIKNDTDPAVRQKCIWALFKMENPEFKQSGADKLLAKMLDESDEKMVLVRYDAARKLADALRDEAPDKTADVLLEMLRNTTLRVFNRMDAKVDKGRADVQANLGGDARYMAAIGLSSLGKKARGRNDVVEALKAATRDSDSRLRESATAALKELGVP